MERHWILWVFWAIAMVGCSSNSGVSEYDVVSTQMQALQDEIKDVVNLRFAVQGCIDARKEYDERLAVLAETQRRHRKAGLPAGSDLPEGLSLEEQIRVLGTLEALLSDEIRNLQKRHVELMRESEK